MILVNPPLSRSVEAPLALARIAGSLKGRGGEALCLDLNAEGFEYLVALGDEAYEPSREKGSPDPGRKLALRRRARDLALLSEEEGYRNFDRYKKAVSGLGSALASLRGRAEIGLCDYRDPLLSPLKREDLVAQAERFEENQFYPLFSRRIDEALGSIGDEWVGISIGFLSQALAAFAIAGYLRAAHPRVKVAIGGGLVNSWVGQGLLAPGEDFGGYVDALLSGRGEDSLGLLLSLEAEGGGEDGSLVPDFSDFALLRYFSPAPVIPYNFSTGCPWRRCAFCPEKAEGQAYAPLRSGRAEAELAILAARHGPRMFHFTDSELSPASLRSLAERPPGARWYGFARFTELLAEPAFARALAASGCAMLQLGLESADQAVLDAMGKGTTVGLYDRVLANLAGAGIPVYAYLLFGTPAEGRDAALRTRDYVARHAGEIAFLNAAIFNLPGASEEAKALRLRDFSEGGLSLYKDFDHPGGWGRAEVRKFLTRDFESEPAIRSIVNRQPPAFTSSHAPFFAPKPF